jgi:hypothetical protein
MDQAILSSAYLGSVGYFTILSRFDKVLIEQYDSYHKQTCRNRCRIFGANGTLDLIIPVVKESGRKTLMKDVKIDFATRWQSIHWRSLSSAYNSSPFFEYYSDYFIPFFQKRWMFLFDYNLELMEMVLGLLQMSMNFVLTEQFQKEYVTTIDLRAMFSPKKLLIKGESDLVNFERYTQTFSEKFEFVPDLSIVDLLFNCGPDSELLLQQNSLKILL